MSHSLIRAVADILTADYRDMKASVAYIDATGIGSGVTPKIRHSKCTGVGIRVAERPTVECKFGDAPTGREINSVDPHPYIRCYQG